MSQSKQLKHDYKGTIISQREKDSYVNLTQMCGVGNKLVADYLRLESTNEYLVALSVNMGIPILSQNKALGLVEVKKGGNQTPGTWAHPEVAIDCAQWVNVDLRIWANRTLVHVIQQRTEPEKVQINSERLTKALPYPGVTLRVRIIRAVDNYVHLFKAAHQQVWAAIYRDLKHTYKYDVKAALKTADVKGRSKLEQVEIDGKLEELRSVAQVVLGADI
jgi:hypothetical protein